MYEQRTASGETMRRRWRVRDGVALVLVMLLCLASGAAAQTSDQIAREAPALADLIGLIPGMTIAEIGAGRGAMSIAMAKLVGPKGRVYAVELDPGALRDIRLAVRRAGVRNVMVIKSGAGATNLPDACCDAIYMRESYHHLADPAAMNASLYKALKPSGLLAIIDAAAPGSAPGASLEGVIREMRQARLELAREIPTWRDGQYALLFQKPQHP